VSFATLTGPEALRQHYRNPGTPARLGLLAIGSFVLGMMVWGSLAPLSDAAIAQGSLQVRSGRQSVQHPYGGVVTHLYVHEGDQVKAGQVLLTLSDTDSRAQLDVLVSQRDALLAAIGRLEAERDGGTAPAFPADLTNRRPEAVVQQTMASETAIMRARAQTFEASVGVAQQKRAQLVQQLQGTQAAIVGLNAQLASVNEQLATAQKLFKSQLAQRSQVLQLQRQVADLQSSVEVKNTDIAGANEAISEADLQIAGLRRSWLSDVANELNTDQAKLAELAPKLAAAQDQLNRAQIAAPASGQVVGQTVFTEGGVIAAGGKILDIVPSDSPMVVDARLPLENIGDVQQGAAADISLLSIPARMRPKIGGKVETVSADRLTDDRSGQSYYLLKVSLNPGDVAKAGMTLQAGMPIEVVVPTRSRTMLDYLVSPLIDEMTGALREK
jgi:HlyD family type I secretion membrane fusion protein